MSITSSSNTLVRATLEATWGALPVSGADTAGSTTIRLTGETLNFNLTKDSSKEINPQRQISSLAVTNAVAQGDLNFEMSFGTYDMFLASALRTNWSIRGLMPASAVSVAVADPNYDVLDFTAAKLFDPANPTAATPPALDITAMTQMKAGQYLTLVKFGTGAPGAGSGAPQETASVRIIEDYAGDKKLKISKEGSFGGGAIPNAILSVSSSYLKVDEHADTRPTFTIEKRLGTNFFSFGGMEVSKMDLSLSTGSFLTGSFSFMGQNGVRNDASVLPTDFESPAMGYPSMSATNGVAEVRMDGDLVSELYSTWIKSMTLSFDNQLEGQMALGVLGSVDNMAKTVQLTGGMSLYLTDGSLYDSFVTSQTMAMSFMVVDTNGNAYAFVLDKIDFNEMPANASADGQAVMLDSKWTGLMDAINTLNSLTIYSLPGWVTLATDGLVLPICGNAGLNPTEHQPTIWMT